jgi:DNA repair protein RecO (recombination protein O)
MDTEHIEGIVLRSQDYKEAHRIITLFTPEGLLSLIVRGISRKNTRLLSLTTPFCHGEYHFRRGRSELFSFRDGTVLDDHFDLRGSLASLQTAGALASAILSSQLAGKPAPALFLLYKAYHKQAALFKNPGALLASFYLKLLKHEGLISLSSQCAQCESLQPLLLHEGESLCSHHQALGGFHFSSLEWDFLLALDSASQFSALSNLLIPPTLPTKIHTLFLSQIAN